MENNVNNNDRLIHLHILGISASQTQDGAFILVLSEVNGKRRIPVIIGVAEAQSIAVWFERLTPPRPLTHDLFSAYVKANNAIVRNVVIYKFEEGVFFAQICISTPGKEDIYLDSRTSDAIAIAIRSSAPIFATPQVMEAVSFAFEEEAEKEEEIKITTQEAKKTEEKPPKRQTLDELKTTLQRLIDNEEYEKAAEVKKMIDDYTNVDE
ncbi:MAG: bifunctional nuclease family protein [Muribaculaceae bacterium]|nr:bifunctional nuclease family protein [Muribaculaceae bacterium]